VTWGLVLALGAGSYLLKMLGLVVIGDRPIPAALDRCLALIPAALIAAIIVSNTLSIGHHLQIDARLAGVSAAVVAASRRAPVLVVIVLGAAVTAVVRAIAG